MPNPAIKNLGEVAFRVSNLHVMGKFYEEIVGLEVLRKFDQVIFFKLAEGHAGHTQVLALFDRSSNSEYTAPDAKRSTVDHIAFGIDINDYEAERKRLESLRLEVTTMVHEWVKWRSLYFHDPEGNLVELVCYDGTL